MKVESIAIAGLTRLIVTVALSMLVMSCAAYQQGVETSAPDALLPLERALRDGRPIPGADKAISHRIALVVGAGAYRSVVPLTNPANDARAVSAMLAKNGFQVIEVIDADQRQFEKAIRDAVVLAGRNAEVVLFFAGHGFQVGKRSYLLPVDGSLDDEYSLPLNTITMENVVEILNARAATQITLLDACRNNPFDDTSVMWRLGPDSLRSTAQGFAEPQPPTGSLIAYATAPGALALDGDGAPNSPFTTALLNRTEARAGVALTDTLPLIRADVLAATGRRQEPTWASELTSGFMVSTPMTESVPPTPIPVSGPPISISLPYERRSAIGARLVASLGLADGQSMTINNTATRGSMMMLPGYPPLADPVNFSISVRDAEGLMYVLAPSQQDTQQTNSVSISEQISVNGRTVSLRLTADACDVEAGGRLDPQGVGLYRHANNLATKGALAACTSAVRREPLNGRFLYQLGRAQRAAGDIIAARKSYRDAWKLGHARAWTAGATLALALEEPSLARTLFDKAVAAGDPLAYRELGRWLLNSDTNARRNEGYDMLDRALDLGVPAAMDDLAQYFADPNSPHIDAARAKLFANAAAIRGFQESDRTPIVAELPKATPALIKPQSDGYN